MSDPVTNMEIEDVLSSIRRLVAEGDKIKQEKKKEYGEAPSEPEKFVLTPALRIAEDVAEESDDPVESDAPMGFAFSDTESADEFEEQSASLKEVFVGEPHAVPQVEEPVSEVAEELGEPIDPVEQTPAEDSRASLEATIAALEAAVTGCADEFEPDGSEVTTSQSWGEAEEVVFDSIRDDVTEKKAPLELTPAEAVAPTEVEDPQNNVEEATADPATDVLDTFETPDHPLDLVSSSDTVADVQKAPEADGRIFRVVPEHPPEPVSEPEEQTEPSAAQMSSTAMYHGSEAVEDEDHGDEMIDDDPKVLAADDDLDRLLTDGNPLDEALLKAVVAEVVKGELQGQLGETITRNVRRLVRREINRVLTHQELD